MNTTSKTNRRILRRAIEDMRQARAFYIIAVITTGLLLSLYASNHRVQANPFPVTNTADSGTGSLRQAIMDANANPGLDTITFSIGTGLQTISPASDLPTITSPVMIDGTTQSGYSGIPIIQLSGANVRTNGLYITAGGSTVKALIVNGFTSLGIRIETNGGNTIQGNYIGTNAAGTGALANQYGVLIDGAPSNTIGGTAASARNVISGNSFSGVYIQNAGATGNQVEGNYIGTNAAGTAALANQYGVVISGAPSNTIGGTAAGARNVISGNSFSNVYIQNAGATGNQVEGNYIGTNAAGAAALANQYGVVISGVASNTIGGTAAGSGNVVSGNSNTGVYIFNSGATGNQVQGNSIGTNAAGTAALANFNGVAIDGASGNTVGGTAAGARNVISGSNNNGVYILNSGATSNQVQGNYIGTNAAGTAALANFNGVAIDGASGNTVGGTAAGARNVVSGNLDRGVFITGNATSNQVQGNFIGTNAAGMAAVKNGFDGLTVAAPASNNVIGGTTPAARNVISGNDIAGVTIESIGTPTGNASGNVVQGNYIGVAVDGTTPLGNTAGSQSGWGVLIVRAATNNLIGGTTPGAANLIAFNAGPGVAVAVGTATGNQIVANSIFGNGGLGIDLESEGVTPNDTGDGDAGPNNLQNYPVLTLATSNGSSTTIQGTLNSAASSAFTIDFYRSAAADPSGYGEGQTFLGSTTVNTNSSGNASFNLNFATPVTLGNVITAVARGNTTGDTSEFSQAATVAAPTAITLAWFAAAGYDNGVKLEWQTGYEVDNLGFNIYREESGERALVNSQILAGSALTTGAGTVIKAGQSYGWWDGAAASKSAQYRIEAIDLNGQSAWYGPISAKFIGGTPPASSNAAVLNRIGFSESGSTTTVDRAVALARLSVEQAAAQVGLAGGAAVKISVKREGWYRVEAADLFAAGLNSKADTRLLQLYADGQQLPIGVITDKDGKLSAIEFYGRGIDAAYTDARVYWLIVGTQPALRIPQVKDDAYPTAARSFLSTVERKDRTVYFSGLRNGERENFFGAVVASQPVEQSLTLQHIDGAAAGQATLEVALQGVSTGQHRVWAYLNGQFAGEILFDGQSQGLVRLGVSQSLLREGDNQVRLVSQGGGNDVSLVDYLRVSYYHSYTADSNSLRFTATGKQAVTVGGFSTGAIRVLDVTNPESVQEVIGKIDQQKSSYSVTVTSPEAGERMLVAIANDQASSAAKVAANLPSSLRNSGHAASFVMITSREFAGSLEPLRMLRISQSYKVELVDIEDVYDEFSAGNKSPQAVRDFLAYATANWKTKPRFVLLAGDASYDAKNYLGLGDFDLVPTKLVDTRYMETASDDWLADFTNDGVPEMAVGRLPFRNVAEATTIVAKIINYEQSRPSEEVLLVADSNEGFDFEQASAQLIGVIPSSLRANQINRGQMDAATAKERLMEAINRGQKLVNYAGHGSANQWRGNLLANEDAAKMQNADHLSVFVMMTCLNGYFDDPSVDSLAESMLKAERGGAVAAWASSGMTLPEQQALMNRQLYISIFGGGTNQRIGEATKAAKAAISDIDIRRTWLLLGDPTMKLR